MTAEQMLGSFPFLVGAACENVDILSKKENHRRPIISGASGGSAVRP